MVQFQLPNFAQSISLAVNVGSQISGGTAPQGIVMTMPSTQAQQPLAAQGSSGQPIQGMVMNAGSTSSGSSTLGICPRRFDYYLNLSYTTV